MSSKPKTKVWNEKEGRFDEIEREAQSENKGQSQKRQNRGQNQGYHNRGQNEAQQNRGQNQGQQNRGQNQGYHNRGQNESQQNRGQNQGHQNRGLNEGQWNRGQNQGQQNRYQNQGQQNRGQNQGQQNRGQNQGHLNQGQQNRGQNQRQQYRGQNERHSQHQNPGQANERGENFNQGQGQGWSQGQPQGGLLPDPQQQYHYPPHMQYPNMMPGGPMYQPVMMQPFVPMYPMQPPPMMPPQNQRPQHPAYQHPPPQQPPPLMNVKTMPSENIQNGRGSGRQNSGRGRPPRGNYREMERSTSMMSLGSINSDRGQEDDVRSNQNRGPRRGGHQNERGQGQRGRMRSKNSSRENLYKSASISGINNIGRDLGARPKQPKHVDDGSGEDRMSENDERNNRNHDTRDGKFRGRGHSRGRGRGNYFRGRGRSAKRDSDSDYSDKQSCNKGEQKEDNENKEEKIHGYLYNNLRGKMNTRQRMNGRYARGRWNFRGRGNGPFRGRPHTFRPDTPPPVDSLDRNEVILSLLRKRGMRGFVRGRGRVTSGRGRFFRGRWRGFVSYRKEMKAGESNEDICSAVTQDDLDDAVSTISDTSFAPSTVDDDISEGGFQDKKKYEICFSDIHTVELNTLKNRIKRYRRKLADMKKKNEDKDEIKNYQSCFEEIQKVYTERKASKEMEKKVKSQLRDTKGKIIQKDEDDNKEKHESISHYSYEETKSKQIKKRLRKTHTLVAGKGYVSYKPKSQVKGKARLSVKKSARVTTDSDSEEESTDVASEEGDADEEIEKKETEQIKKRRQRTRNKRKNKVDEDKLSYEERMRLTGILSKLEKLGMNGDVTEISETEQVSTSRERVNSVNESDSKSEDSKPEPGERSRKTSESKVQGPDVNEVFKFMVTTLEGKGTPEEIKRESGLFPIDCDEVAWFRKFKNRFTIIEKNGIVELVLVFDRNATHCLDYSRNKSCKKEGCNRYHICKNLLAGTCTYGESCKFSHDFLDERNTSVSKRLGYNHVFNSDQICSVLGARYPHVCQKWIDQGSCDESHCTRLHLCPRYIHGQCLEGEDCPLIHDRFSEHNKPIVDAYGMGKLVDTFFRKMIYMTRQSDIEKREDEATNKPVQETRRRKNLPKQKRHDSGDSEQSKPEKDEELGDSAMNKPICEKNLLGSCRRQRCKFLHCKKLLPYQWQMKLHGTWINLEETEKIEKAFCNNQEFFYEFHLVHDGLDFSVTIQFRPKIRASAIVMGTEDAGIDTEVRRLSTLSYKEGENNPEGFKTQWRWCWMDDHHIWNQFEPDAMQHTLEVKFLANQKEFYYSRENYRFKYILDFKEMSQLNIDTRKQREISRRPLFVSEEDVKAKLFPKSLLAAPVVETPLPESWVPWDLAYPFELVKIDENDIKFSMVSDSFFRTLDRGKIRIDAIFRMQNHKLWSLYCSQERIMEANFKRLGHETAVDKRYLFHGTDSLDAVRGISINNFDVRVSGKNATMYGDGAYFARDASYSHNYTKGPERFMFMVTVLVGHYTQGNKSYRRPPNKPGSDHELFDSCVNDITNPSIFIVFDKNQYYPEYLIQYHKMYEEVDTETYIPRPTPVPRKTGTIGSSSASLAGASHGVNVHAARPSAPSIQPLVYPSSYSDTSFSGSGNTASQSSGTHSPTFASPYRSDPVDSRPRPAATNSRTMNQDPFSQRKKDDSSCSIQ